MARRKISGRDLAEALGWSRSTTWRRLNGTTPLKLDELTAVAAFLEVSVTDLLPQQDAA